MKLQRSPYARTQPEFKINQKDDEAEVLLYDEIGFFGIDATSFINQFNQIDAKTINLRINSPGGSVFDGIAIANAIERHKSNVIVHIDSLAASIASYIAMSGNEIRMAKNARIMIHEPFSIVLGTADDMRREAELLDGIGETIADAYTERSGQSKKDVLKAMKDETWYTADEAKEFGLIDEIENTKKTENKFDLSVFNNVPDELIVNSKEFNARRMERALREEGCTCSEAKSLVSSLKALRDEKPTLRDEEIDLNEFTYQPLDWRQ